MDYQNSVLFSLVEFHGKRLAHMQLCHSMVRPCAETVWPCFVDGSPPEGHGGTLQRRMVGEPGPRPICICQESAAEARGSKRPVANRHGGSPQCCSNVSHSVRFGSNLAGSMVWGSGRLMQISLHRSAARLYAETVWTVFLKVSPPGGDEGT